MSEVPLYTMRPRGVLFLMSEVPLYTLRPRGALFLMSELSLYTMLPMGDLFLMSEVPLYTMRPRGALLLMSELPLYTTRGTDRKVVQGSGVEVPGAPSRENERSHSLTSHAHTVSSKNGTTHTVSIPRFMT